MITCNSFQRYFPRTLEALILHMLSPVAAEVLTQKFDEMDQQTGEDDRFCSEALFVVVVFFFHTLKLEKNLKVVFLYPFPIRRNQFYREFYGAFDDESAAMDIILSKKEGFAFQVCSLA